MPPGDPPDLELERLGGSSVTGDREPELAGAGLHRFLVFFAAAGLLDGL